MTPRTAKIVMAALSLGMLLLGYFAPGVARQLMLF